MIPLLNLITNGLLLLLGVVAWIIQLWALLDCVRTKPADFQSANKRTKTFWVAMTAASAVFGLFFILNASLGFMMLIDLAGVTAASVYLADVRPEVHPVRRGGTTRNQGPYGPW